MGGFAWVTIERCKRYFVMAFVNCGMPDTFLDAFFPFMVDPGEFSFNKCVGEFSLSQQITDLMLIIFQGTDLTEDFGAWVFVLPEVIVADDAGNFSGGGIAGHEITGDDTCCAGGLVNMEH